LEKILRAIGLMSGTSLDGVDVALIETDGETVFRRGPYLSRSYSDDERRLLRQALDDAAGIVDRRARPGSLQSAEGLITAAHAEAVERFLSENAIEPSSVDVIGFHGQTVLHRPEAGLTIQIGDGQDLANRLGLPVIHDFRAADIAAGGQGAPLVPIYHAALLQGAGMKPPIAILNIGGVANVTFIGEGTITAFDTGPGNALIDDFIFRRTGRPYDEGGKVAALGRPDEALLAWLMAHPFFLKVPPKSLDRNWFSAGIVAHLSLEDGAATLTEFTARAVARAADFAPAESRRWIVAGGGARNATLCGAIERWTGCTVEIADALGWNADALEAEAFAFLAIRSLLMKPLSYPGTTGVGKPMTGGTRAEPQK
jgi:anhydro-N-acetylmuramic acid kinase